MRTTGDFERLQLWRPLFDADVFRPERIVAVRGETIFRDRVGIVAIDIAFVRDDGTIVVVPALLVDGTALARNNRRGFVWPRSAAAHLDEVGAAALEDRIVPWLRSLGRGRAYAGEFVRRFAPCPAFDEARARGLLGAATYGASLVTLAPVLFSQRYGSRATGRARGRQSASHAAGLRLQCAVVDHDADALGTTWFSLAPSTAVAYPTIAIVDDAHAAADARFAIALDGAPDASWRTIDVPRPVALDVFTTFDRADAPVVATFAVRGAEGPERSTVARARATPVGGSSGIVRIAVRDDAWAVRDVDTDDAEELVARLRSEGLDALAISYSRSTTEAADLVHYYATYDEPAFLRAAEVRRLRGEPYAITLAPQSPWTGWAEDAHFHFSSQAQDDGREKSFRRAFEAGRLRLDGIPWEEDPAESGIRESLFATIAEGAAAIFLSVGEDVAAFHARYPGVQPGRVMRLAPFLPDDAPSMPLGALIGDEPFVLVHGAVLNRSRQLPVVTGLAREGIPCVVAGPLADVYLGVTMRRYGGERTVFLTDPTPGELTALYHRAALLVDPSPRPIGYGRLIRASRSGALPIVPTDSPAVRLFAGTVPTYDGASATSVAATLRAAFTADDTLRLRALRAQAAVAPSFDGDRAFASVVAAYAAT
jgi:hypothetical protein